MISNFKRDIREFRLWQFIDKTLSLKDNVLQGEIINFGIEKNLGSRKAILDILKYFLNVKLISEIELSPDGPGRPRKAYTRTESLSDEPILVNLGGLPKEFHIFINDLAKGQNGSKSEIIIQLLTWSLLQYKQNLDQVSQFPTIEPPHLSQKSKVFNRISKY